MRQNSSLQAICLVTAIVSWMAAGSLLSARLSHPALAADWLLYPVAFGLVFGPIVMLMRQGTLRVPAPHRDRAPS